VSLPHCPSTFGTPSIPLQAAEDEQRRVMSQHGDALDMDVLNSMDTLHLNIQEALRMNPPLLMLMRLAKEAFTITTSSGKTYTIPKVGLQLEGFVLHWVVCVQPGLVA
jgi:hypothetical protein